MIIYILFLVILVLIILFEYLNILDKKNISFIKNIYDTFLKNPLTFIFSTALLSFLYKFFIIWVIVFYTFVTFLWGVYILFVKYNNKNAIIQIYDNEKNPCILCLKIFIKTIPCMFIYISFKNKKNSYRICMYPLTYIFSYIGMLPIRAALYITPALNIERALGKRGIIKLYQLIQNIKTIVKSVDKDLVVLLSLLKTWKIIVLNKKVIFNPIYSRHEHIMKNISYFLDKIEHKSPHLCIYNAKKVKHVAWLFSVNNEKIGVVYTSKPYLKAEDILTKKNYKIPNLEIRKNQFTVTSIIENEKPITIDDDRLLLEIFPNIPARIYDLNHIMTTSNSFNTLFKQNKDNTVSIVGESIDMYENNLLAHAMYLKHACRSKAQMPYIINSALFHEKNKFLLNNNLSISEKLTILHNNMLNEHGEEQTNALYSFVANSLKDYNKNIAEVEITELRKTKIKAFEFMSDILYINTL